MTVLIVDDEIYAVRTIQRCVEWESAGVDTVLTAFNAAQAKEILAEKEVDIVITDIEMPGENGLVMLKWARERGYDGIAICLTCHAEFTYAQEAMHQSVMEYVVKPVNIKELGELVARAAEQRRQEMLSRTREDKGLLWDHHKERLEREFWQDLIDGKMRTPAELLKRAGQLHIAYDVNEQYRLILLHVRGIADRREEWNEQRELMMFVIHNISRDLFVSDEDAGKTGWRDLYMWIILPEGRTAELYGQLENFLDVCFSITGAKLTAYLDTACFGEELHEKYQKLLNRDYKNTSVEQGVIDCSLESAGEAGKGTDLWKLPTEQICGWITGKQFSDVRQYASSVRDSGLEIGQRERFFVSERIWQELYRYFDKNHISLEQFWTDVLVGKALHIWQSMPDLMDWLSAAADRLEELGAKTETNINGNEMTAQIRAYVREHVEERISREQIAEHVNFSADYISRSFKKESGMSLSEYIIREKIARAKELIAEGEDTIGDIAVRLGYNNFSYFSEIFKRIEGVLPSDYRRQI